MKPQHRVFTQNQMLLHAVHEAGHAIVAVYLKIGFQKTFIARKPFRLGRNWIAGLCETNEGFSYRSYKQTIDKNGAEIFVETDVAALKRDFYRKHIIICYAGRVAEEMLFNAEPNGGDRIDLQIIKSLKRAGKFSTEDLKSFRQRAQQILRKSFVFKGLLFTAHELTETLILTSSAVRGHLRVGRNTSPETFETWKAGFEAISS